MHLGGLGWLWMYTLASTLALLLMKTGPSVHLSNMRQDVDWGAVGAVALLVLYAPAVRTNEVKNANDEWINRCNVRHPS